MCNLLPAANRSHIGQAHTAPTPVVELKRKPLHGGNLEALLNVKDALGLSGARHMCGVGLVAVRADIKADLGVREDGDVQAVAANGVAARVDVDLDV